VAADTANMNNSVRFFILESGRVKRLLEDMKTSAPISETKLYEEYWLYSAGAGHARPAPLVQFRARMLDLASEMGFKRQIERTANGGQAVWYSGLTIVGKTAA